MTLWVVGCGGGKSFLFLFSRLRYFYLHVIIPFQMTNDVTGQFYPSAFNFDPGVVCGYSTSLSFFQMVRVTSYVLHS